MRITPLELRSHPFEKRWGRLDPEEVGAFLEMVAEDFESLTPGWWTGNARSKRLLTSEKIATLQPTPKASDKTAASVKPGVRNLVITIDSVIAHHTVL